MTAVEVRDPRSDGSSHRTAPRGQRQLDPRQRVITAASAVLAALLLGFLLNVSLVGALKHNRDQAVARADLREQLALGTAPVSDLTFDGLVVALGAPLAIVEIPSLGVDEVVFQGSTSGVLRSGPGHRRDTVMPGQTGTSIVMGRRAAYGAPFAQLKELNPGDEIRITTGQGVNTFRVLDVRRDGDPRPTPVAAGASRVTLMTADGAAFAPAGVLRVDADLVSDVMPAARPSLTIRTLPESERLMAGDDGALVPLLLWAEGLLLAAVALTWARSRWGGRQAWVAGVPVLGLAGLAVADQLGRLLPNML